MPMYIFTYNQQEKSFPERYRVIAPEEDAELIRESEALSGTVQKAAAMDFLDELMARYKAQESMTTEMVDAPNWEFIELRFNPAAADESVKPRFI